MRFGSHWISEFQCETKKRRFITMPGQLSGSGIEEITAVVVHYCVGVQPGTGGMAMAYGGAIARSEPRLVALIANFTVISALFYESLRNFLQCICVP
ncbi:hypothetical protein ACFOGG_18770 [Brenneria rubrifaciens]|uniref:hypothetical protein n=1 Tax=Brenneria rubrifaciens TaxID=55213 RepID=UPI00360EB91D